MRGSLVAIIGLFFLAPSSASATCWRSHCYGCTGSCYGSARCYGCYGCSGCHGCTGYWNYSSGCYGCYGYGYSYGTPWTSRYGMPSTSYNRPLPSHSGQYSTYHEPGSRKVKLQVIVDDPQARISIDGQSTTSTGTMRRYESGEITANQDFSYTIALQRGGVPPRPDDTRTVYVRAGDSVVIDFTRLASP